MNEEDKTYLKLKYDIDYDHPAAIMDIGHLPNDFRLSCNFGGLIKAVFFTADRRQLFLDKLIEYEREQHTRDDA